MGKATNTLWNDEASQRIRSSHFQQLRDIGEIILQRPWMIYSWRIKGIGENYPVHLSLCLARNSHVFFKYLCSSSVPFCCSCQSSAERGSLMAILSSKSSEQIFAGYELMTMQCTKVSGSCGKCVYQIPFTTSWDPQRYHSAGRFLRQVRTKEQGSLFWKA